MKHTRTEMQPKRFLILFTLPLLTFLMGCKKDTYHQIVKSELASGKRYDSLFLGVSFGMARQDFYNLCWDLNKRKIATQGPSNMSVEYTLTELKEPALVRFYPNFYDERIYEIPSSITYAAWAPWNKHLSADSLLEDMKVLLEEKYGPGWITVTRDEDKKKAYVLVNGNRRISLYTVSDQYIHALYTDLTVEPQAKLLKEEQMKESESR